MSKLILPERIPALDESIYAGFGLRIGALVLDFLVMIPVIALIVFMQTISRDMYYYSLIVGAAVGIALNVIMVQSIGATPGKYFLGLQIVKLDGDPVGWNEAIMRYLVDFCLLVASYVVGYLAVSQIGPDEYASLSFMERGMVIQGKEPELISISSWAMNIWMLSEYIVLLTNKRRRGFQDFIGETVVIKKKLIPRIEQWKKDNEE